MAERYHFAYGAHIPLRAAAQLGVPEEAVLRDAGVTPSELPPGACRMPWTTLRAVTASALKLTREPAFNRAFRRWMGSSPSEWLEAQVQAN